MNVEDCKRRVAEKALEFVEDNSIIGLGSGSTVAYFLESLGKYVNEEGLDITGIPSSVSTASLAGSYGIKIGDMNDYPVIDITIDGADEISRDLDLIKGLGGALLREKIMAKRSKREVIIADYRKYREGGEIGEKIPVEVLPFCYKLARDELRMRDGRAEIRMSGGDPFITDNSNYILDCEFSEIGDLKELERDINDIIGVIENGIFIGLTDLALIGYDDRIDTISLK